MSCALLQRLPAFEEYQKAGEKGTKVKSLEILTDAIVRSSENMALALKSNSKIIMLGGNGNGSTDSGNSLLNMIPMFSLLTENGLLSLVPEEFRPVKKPKIC